MKNVTEEDKKSLKDFLSEEVNRNDVDDEGSARYKIANLAQSSDTTAIINKINEIINEFNKSLIDNRI